MTNRRQFLGATAAGAFAFPFVLPASARGANDRVVTGHIGVGGQGTFNLKALLKHAAAVCDCDRDRREKAAKLLGGNRLTAPAAYDDYRRVLDRNDIDAVVVSTPDHWHALMTIHACQAGKDVYCEKPLSLTVTQGRAMVEAARKFDRVVQTGSQQRSAANFRRACEYVRSGRVGKVKTVQVGLVGVNFAGAPVPDSRPPEALDYDRWLGPAPLRPYNARRSHYDFRWFWDYAGGQMTNFGAHHIDIAQWGLGTDDTGPVRAVGTATYHPEHWFEVPQTCRVTFTYADGTTLVVGQGEPDIIEGVTFVGTEGTISVSRGRLWSKPDDLVLNPLTGSEVHLEESANHHENFLDCVKTRRRPIADVEIGHRTATICHLGNIAIRLGRQVRWAPAAETVVDDPEALAMLSRPYRAPWAP